MQTDNKNNKKIISPFAKYLFFGSILGAITVNRFPLLGIFFPVLGGVIGEYKERKQKRANKNETEPKKAVSTKEKNTSRCIKYKIQGKEYTKEEIEEITQKSYLQEKNIFKEYNNQKTYEKK